VPLLLGWIGPSLIPGLDDPETILPELSQRLLPAALNLLFAGALIAAILSTVDSCLLVVAAVVARNLVPHHAAGAASPTGRLGLARWAVVGAGLVAYGLACSRWNVKELVEQASGFGSAGVFVLAVVGLYARGGRALAANLTLVTGLSTWLLTRFVYDESFEHPYLISLLAAGLAFALGRTIEWRLRVPAPPPPRQSPP
jgi:Na+/proline symporter